MEIGTFDSGRRDIVGSWFPFRFCWMSDDELRLRPTLIAGETAPEDYQVFWNGLQIGRILKQPGVPTGRPNWH
jgi:hypothetical protein